MEDWGYAASWDTSFVKPCAPRANGGYDASRTTYNEQMVRAFRWETLTPPLYQAFEALFRHYHVTKGHMRYEAAGGGGGGSSLFSKLLKKGRDRPDEATRLEQSQLERLAVEVMPSSLAGIEQL